MPDENPKKVKLVFDVMPGDAQQTEHKDIPVAENKISQAENAPKANQQAIQPGKVSGTRSPLKYIVIGLAVVALAVGGYFGYMWVDENYLNKEEEVINQPPPTPTLPEAWLQQYFGSNICQEQALCGTDADPDKDGLTNLRENELKTNPLNADSDHDGLADNDEIRVYETEPIVSDTDGDSFEDGAEIRNGFSPKIASANPASSIEMQIINENIAKYPLHEITSLFLSLTPFETKFGGEEENTAGLTIGLPQNWIQDEGTINPMIFSGTSTSTQLVLSKAVVSATSTTASLVESAAAAAQTQYESLEREEGLEEEAYTIGESDVKKLSFSFVDQGRNYRMEVIYVRKGENLVTAAVIASDTAFINIQTLVSVMLTSVRIME